MKVINYVYAVGVYVLINAALYGSEYSKVTGVHGRSFITEELSDTGSRLFTGDSVLSTRQFEYNRGSSDYDHM